MIKLPLNSGKNVGPYYHFTKSAENFYLICDDLTLRAGRKEERGPEHSSKEPFVSITRDKNLDRHTGDRYFGGFILSGSVLSDNYKMEPISYAQYQMTNRGVDLRLLTLTRYQNGICKISFVGMNSSEISEKTFQKIANVLENLPEDVKSKKHLTKRGPGTRKVSGVGAPIDIQYKINTKHGLILNTNSIPELNQIVSDIGNIPRVSESEERIWRMAVNIKLAIRGVILPKSISGTDLPFVQKGMKRLYEQGIAIVPDDSDIGYSGTDAFRIERR